MNRRCKQILTSGIFVLIAGAGLYVSVHSKRQTPQIVSSPATQVSIQNKLPPPKERSSSARAATPVVVPMAEPAAAAVSAWVREIVGETDPPAPFHVRRSRVAGLGTALPAPEREALRDYLTQPLDPALSPGESAALRNEIANRLRVQHPPMTDLDRAFMDMAVDPRQDPVWRDYCIQHLGTMLRTMDPAVARDCFRNFVSSGSNVAAGTALLAMSREPEIFPVSEVADKAASFLSDGSAPEAVRVTALQILAAADFDRALPFARDALSAPAPQHVRLSSLAVLSRSSDAKDREILRRFSRSSNPLLAKAARQALRVAADNSSPPESLSDSKTTDLAPL